MDMNTAGCSGQGSVLELVILQVVTVLELVSKLVNVEIVSRADEAGERFAGER